MSSNTNSELNKIFFILFFLFCLFNNDLLCDIHQQRVYKRYYLKKIEGKVIDIFINKNNKYQETFVILTEIDTIRRCDFYSVDFYYIQIGDSIVKKENSFDLYIYKQCNKDSLIFLKSEDADYKEYIKRLQNQ